MCTVLLPPGDNPIAVNKCIISDVNGKTKFDAYNEMGGKSGTMGKEERCI